MHTHNHVKNSLATFLDYTSCMVLHFPHLKYSSKWFCVTGVVIDVMGCFSVMIQLAIWLQTFGLSMVLAGWCSSLVGEVNSILHI